MPKIGNMSEKSVIQQTNRRNTVSFSRHKTTDRTSKNKETFQKDSVGIIFQLHYKTNPN